MKTESEIERDIMSLMEGCDLLDAVDGALYRNGYRPRDSKKEDITVTFIAGVPGEVQSGTVLVRIYLPDVVCCGVSVKNPRCGELERLADDWVGRLTADRSNYLFELSDTIHTVREEDLCQHYVAVRLKYLFYE